MVSVHRNGSQVCDWCGVFLHYRPHPVILTVDGYVMKRVVLCVKHRDELQKTVTDWWDEQERRARDPEFVSA